MNHDPKLRKIAAEAIPVFHVSDFFLYSLRFSGESKK